MHRKRTKVVQAPPTRKQAPGAGGIEQPQPSYISDAGNRDSEGLGHAAARDGVRLCGHPLRIATACAAGLWGGFAGHLGRGCQDSGRLNKAPRGPVWLLPERLAEFVPRSAPSRHLGKRKKAQKGACQQGLAAVNPDCSGTQKRSYENYRSHFPCSNCRAFPLASGSANLRH
jgi:hypothetical protein